MIRFTIDQKRGTYFVDCIGTVQGRVPISFKAQGSKELMRQRLRAEFTYHLHILVRDIQELITPKKNQYVDAVAERLLQAEKYGCGVNHISYARQLEHLLPELHILQMATTNLPRLEQLTDDLHRTVNYMVEAQYSRWVRGDVPQNKAA